MSDKKIIGAVGGILVVIAFFLTWISVPGSGSLSGLALAQAGAVTLAPLLWLFPLAGLAVAGLSFGLTPKDQPTIRSAQIGAGALLIVLILIQLISVISLWSIGAYITLLGVIAMLGGGLMMENRPIVDPSELVKPKSNVVKVDKIGMIYDVPGGDDVEALKDVSFTLEEGRILTLLGPSGCGKTTLLNIMAGFLAPTSGQVTLGGVPIDGPGQDRGMVFQQGALFEWLSVAENVGFGPDMNGKPAAETKKVVDDLLNIVGLSGFGDKKVYELSGGMQQRVALARCLANDPGIILMDEPLGALDALTREKMQGLILKLWEETGKTIILVTHSVEEALFLGDQLFVMAPRPGRIERIYNLPFAAQGLHVNPRELKTSPEFIQKREEILSLIWEMEEEIMNQRGEVL